MIQKFTSGGMRRAPDQTVFRMNEMRQQMESRRSSIRLTSADGKNVIILGEGHPIDPTTSKPYPFGIREYAVKGDRLELIGEVQWT